MCIYYIYFFGIYDIYYSITFFFLLRHHCSVNTLHSTKKRLLFAFIDYLYRFSQVSFNNDSLTCRKVVLDIPFLITNNQITPSFNFDLGASITSSLMCDRYEACIITNSSTK